MENFIEEFLAPLVVIVLLGGMLVAMVVLIVSLLTGKIESKPFHLKLTTDKKITTNQMSELEKCANCGRDIGKLEKACVFKDQIVCAECHQRLKNQE